MAQTTAQSAQSTRGWLPLYCHPEAMLPAVQETVVLFSRPPYLFADFVGKAIAYLQSDAARDIGFDYDPATALPCKWRCADESVFGVDLTLFAYTGHYPFDKGRIGGRYNESALSAAVHHSRTNIDFGGSHVGYIPGPDGGRFGHITRPLCSCETSTDCGYLMSVTAPFKRVYDDACANIVVFSPAGEDAGVLVSIPNEFLQPSWCRERVKLLVDLERISAGVVPYDVEKAYTHKIAGRTLFRLSSEFLAEQSAETVQRFQTADKTPIGNALGAKYFNIYDADAEIDCGVPTERLLPYMKYILSSVAPYPLKAAVTNTNIEFNQLVDSIRAVEYTEYSFACFAGVFIDIYDPMLSAYVNLFQPIGAAIKPAGRTREIEIGPSELRSQIEMLDPVRPAHSLQDVLGYDEAAHILEQFTYTPVNRR